MDLASFRKACGECSDEELVKACFSIDQSIKNADQAKVWIWSLIKRLLDTERYTHAGLLLWGEALFNPGPRAVQQLLKKVRETQNLIVLGGAALGKTYTLICYCLLDWLRDPEYTEIKVISTTGGHAKSQSFSTLQRLYKAAIIPLPGLSMDSFVGLNPKDRHSAIVQIAIPQGEDGRGVLQGFHPMPRTTPHPIFGSMSRVRAFLDESEEIPAGVWAGVSNLLGSAWGPESVKVFCCTNPRDPTSKLGQLAEPRNGWGTIDLDHDKEWVSQERWSVLRLDGSDCENCIERKLVYPGFLTWEGYQKFALELGGQSPNYLTFGRGMYPLSALQNSLIPYSLLEATTGTFIFDQRTTGIAGVDLAFETGGDRVIVFTGRYGRAIGFHALNGKPTLWQKPRFCVQAEQFFELPKQKTIALATSIQELLTGLKIDAEWTAVDKSGVGHGVVDALAEQWKPVKGIAWGTDAGNRRILAEDSDFSYEIYDGIACELYMRIRKFLEFGYLCFHPQIQTGQLFKELTGRRFQPATKGPSGKSRIRLESNRDYRKRLGVSPDLADALALMCHVAGVNGPEKARMGNDRPRQSLGSNIGHREKTAYIDFSNDF